MVLWDQITSQCLIEERDYSGTDLKEIPADKILDGSAGISLQNDLLLINEEHPLAEEEVGSLSPYKDTDLLMQDSTPLAVSDKSVPKFRQSVFCNNFWKLEIVWRNMPFPDAVQYCLLCT